MSARVRVRAGRTRRLVGPVGPVRPDGLRSPCAPVPRVSDQRPAVRGRRLRRTREPGAAGHLQLRVRRGHGDDVRGPDRHGLSRRDVRLAVPERVRRHGGLRPRLHVIGRALCRRDRRARRVGRSVRGGHGEHDRSFRRRDRLDDDGARLRGEPHREPGRVRREPGLRRRSSRRNGPGVVRVPGGKRGLPRGLSGPARLLHRCDRHTLVRGGVVRVRGGERRDVQRRQRARLGHDRLRVCGGVREHGGRRVQREPRRDRAQRDRDGHAVGVDSARPRARRVSPAR